MFRTASLPRVGAPGARDAECDETRFGPAGSMLASAQRLAVRVRRRERLGPMLLLSVALHLTLFLSLLFIPSTPLPTGEAAPASLEVVADEGTPEGVKLPTPSYAPEVAAPTAPLPTPIQPP